MRSKGLWVVEESILIGDTVVRLEFFELDHYWVVWMHFRDGSTQRSNIYHLRSLAKKAYRRECRALAAELAVKAFA